MYVRWRTRKKKPTWWTGTLALPRAAILVENLRVDGKPTQKHIAYLCGFAKSKAEASVPQRCMVWHELTQKLDHLGDRITLQDREKIEAAIAKKISRPTAEEWEENNRRRAELGIDPI